MVACGGARGPAAMWDGPGGPTNKNSPPGNGRAVQALLMVRSAFF